MSFGRCPYCSDKISLPDKAAPFARVQCPLCREEFVLSEVLDRLPPKLIVLDAEDSEDSADAIHPTPASLATIEPDASSPEDFKIAPLDSDDPNDSGNGRQQAAAPFAINTGDDYAEEQQPTARRITTSGRKKGKNPLVEVVKIVLGGVAGITIALLILLWLPGKWQKDPLKIGSKIGKYAPFMVPANFRPGWKAKDSEFDENAASEAGFAAAARKHANTHAGASMGELPDFSEALQRPPNASADDSLDDSSSEVELVTSRESPPAPEPAELKSVTETQPAAAVEPQPVDPLSVGSIELDLSVGAKPTPTKPGDSSSASEKPVAEKPNTAKPKNEPEEAPPKTSDQADPSAANNPAALQAALKMLTTSQQTLVAADAGKLAAAANGYYSALATLGKVLAVTPDENAEGIKQTLAKIDEALGPQVLQEKKLAVAIRDLGPQRLAKAEIGAGVALIGSIQKMEEADGVFLTILKLFSSEKTVTLVQQQDSRESFAPGARVVVVGALLPDPEEVFPAFEKDAPPVVVHPHVVVLAR